MNTRFEYGYTDAANYKTWNSVILGGTLTQEEIDEIRNCCDDGVFFIAEQLGLRHDFPGEVCEDDHCWCHLYDDDGFTQTEEAATSIDAAELLNRFKAAKGSWDEATYDPSILYS